jgi:hypothetical protein
MKHMTRTIRTLLGVAMVAGLAAGCSGSGAAMETFRIGKNVAKKDSHLRIFLDGHEAKQDKLKKGYFGYASFKVKEQVGTSPTFRFAFDEPDKLGRITGTNIQVHQEFEADYSHQPEFTIYPASTDSTMLMKPATEYPLGAVPSNLRCMNFEKQQVAGVTLKPGVEYLLVFTVSGDRSETVQVLFSTK